MGFTLAEIRLLTAQTALEFPQGIILLSPDTNTEVLDDLGNRVNVRQFSVMANQALFVDPNWENVSIGYSVIVPNELPIDATENYWVQIDEEIKKVSFSHYWTKRGFYHYYFKGN